MQYTVINDFRLGIDSRRYALSSPPGTLTDLVNAHITAGGEAEKRGRFVGLTLPTNCYGLQSTSAGLLVFGSVDEGDLNAALPDGVTYQQLEHPNGTGVMVGIVHSAVFNGLAFAIADFGADGIVSYYDGVVVDDLSPGKLATILSDADALADYIAGLVNGTDDFTATVTGGEVTITGPAGQPFRVSVSNESSCTTTVPAPDVDGDTITAMTIELTGSFSATGGSGQALVFDVQYTRGAVDETDNVANYENSFGSNSLNTGVSDLHNYFTSIPISLLAGSGSSVIASLTAEPGYTITALNASFSLSYTVNGTAYTATGTLTAPGQVTFTLQPPATLATITPTQTVTAFDGFDGTAARAQFEVIAVDDSSTAPTNQCVQVTADKGGAMEQDLLVTPVEVAASKEAMAQAIADEINANTTTTGFSATVSGALVIVSATADFEDWNGKSLTVEVAGAVAIGNAKVGIAKLSGSATIPTINDVKIGDVSIIDTGGGSITGASVAELCTNVAYRINTDTDPHTTEFFAAAVGEAVFITKRFTTNGDAPLTITVDITNGTTTADSAGSPMRITASPTTVGNGSTWSGGVRSSYVTVTVAGGVAPYYYRWEQITDTAIMVHFPNSYRTDFTAYAADVAGLPVTSQWKCIVTDSAGSVGESNPITARLTKAGG